MNEETKKVFSSRPMVSSRSPHKMCSNLVRAKLYPLDRVVGSTKCGKERFEVRVTVCETNTFTRNVTGKTYKINHKLNCDDNYFIYFLFCSVAENNMLGKQLTALGIDGITIRIMVESILVRRAVCKNVCLNVLTA